MYELLVVDLEAVYMNYIHWLLGLSDYIAMFELRQRFTNIWAEPYDNNQVFNYICFLKILFFLYIKYF